MLDEWESHEAANDDDDARDQQHASSLSSSTATCGPVTRLLNVNSPRLKIV